MKKYCLFLLLLFLVLAAVEYFNNSTPKNPAPSSGKTLGVQIGERTKTADCMVNGSLPDSACTPGSVFPEVSTDQICTPGYSKSVRNVPVDIKRQVYEEYNIATHSPGQYEVDHLISLELGGSNDIANLWPEAADPRPGFHEKDQVENYLHSVICSGKITLEEAQKNIAGNWLEVYRTMPK